MKLQDKVTAFISKDRLILLLFVIVLYSILHVFGIGCPIKFITGISCGGCGMGRAWFSVMKLDFSGAFHYHPLFPLPLVVICLLMFRKKLTKKLFNLSIFVIVTLFIVVYFFRLLDGSDNIVEININNGLIGHVINKFSY